MNTVIFRTIAPYLSALMMVFSIFVLLRGHNEPGGGFIGGLIAVSAFAIYGIACGVAAVRRSMVVHPMSLAGIGLFIAVLSVLPSYLFGQPPMTSQWLIFDFLGSELKLSTPLVFDIGVYLVVVGAITSIALSLEERDVD
ncbi:MULTISPECIES: Na+/H+ antiporter subunit B [Pseudovibrio]|uniref:Na+/H+ antiporter subunit B n=1 Tax=Stappiaceae TaxID=2821832 RepID=UPI0023660797|nr:MULTISPECIES: Na+/H+ antiporter subunit B [Pseudovibrio]MDD7909173.1 Na+/H+ antiporter subunit B [Pseudovibrio exalbescens]MDX5595618.1 Na+/H+ antiporter subunit B [Pseudovibrio sp. SPO723]